MALLTETFSINDLPDQETGDYSPIPAGDYTAVIKNAEVKMTNDGTGQYIKLRMDVTGPTHANRVIWSNLNIRNKSAEAERIGRAQLKTIMLALGLDNLQDSDQLIGGHVRIKVGIREARTDEKTGKTYEASNEVKSFKPVDGAIPAPAMSAPKPAAAPSKGAPPWIKK